MAENNLIRNATVDEKKEFVELTGKRNYVDKVIDLITKEQQKFVILHKPFCARCARLDFEDNIAKVQKTQNENVNPTQEDLQVEVPNMSDYSKASRFELIDVNPVFEDKLIDGMRASTETGKWDNYKCKNRGCGLSVFVPKLAEKK